MSFLDSFERKGLFRFTRVLALLVIALLIFGVIGGAFYFSSTLVPTTTKHIQPTEVIAAITSTPAQSNEQPNNSSGDTEANATADTFPGLKIPLSLQPYFSIVAFRDILSGKLTGMQLTDQQEYVDNMGQIVDAAKTANLKEADAIEAYVRMKDERLEAVSAHKTEVSETRIYVLATAASALGLIGLFSLILVLLAIERNTRVRSAELVTH